ncbi:tetratricopeptide repeat protein [Paenibacillus soyae]|uniref:Tetratricopeptide repeat protein n=1 Tax=Paenibacillus soyae TaxID=2969249 RepID=A0A9X2SAF3_9BACL|nr:tetratricopeptide repeat protein [Paenibacillus soyae]MCR2804488.1 tetratricopeptide repeat protein [Paenibacillus soyae]
MKLFMIIVATLLIGTACTSKEYKAQMAAGEEALSEQKFDEAARAFTIAIEEGEHDRKAKDRLAATEKMKVEAEVAAILDQGKKAYDDGRYELAISTLSALLEKHEGNLEIRPYVVDAKLILAHAIFDLRLAEGKQYVENGQYKDAIEAFNAALKLRPYDKAVKELRQGAQQKLDELTGDQLKLHNC